MDWIKKNAEKFTLLLVALALLAVSVLLILKVRTFLATFEGLKAPVIENNKVPDLDLSPLGDARTAIQKPGAWTGHPGSLFVSRRYIFRDPDLVDPFEISPGKPPVQLHPPVPNEWFIKYNLDITDNEKLYHLILTLQTA